jgi:hypothetical protein
MALSASRLSAAIRANLVARTWAVDGPELTAFCDDLASAIVTEITAHATVPALGLISPPGTVGGPVTGSAVVT